MVPEAERNVATIAPFDPQALTSAELDGLRDLHNAVARQTSPNDPARPRKYVRDLYASLAEATEYDRRFWWARRGNAILGALVASTRCTGDNPHVMHLELMVAPSARRRGIGRTLVTAAAKVARAQGQNLLIGLVTGQEPLSDSPGGRFLTALGAQQGLPHRIYRLQLGAVDSDELNRWTLEGARRSPGVDLIWRLGPFRDDDLVAVSQLMRLMNTAPRGDLKVEPYVYTATSVYERDRAMFARGFRRAVLLARQRSDRALLGYTMMLIDPYDDRLLRQADTAVEPAARGRGLGKWLKAAMLLRMMHDHPSRTEVRTGNADSNKAILEINRRIGFRPWLAHSVWQVSLDTLQAALNRSAQA